MPKSRYSFFCQIPQTQTEKVKCSPACARVRHRRSKNEVSMHHGLRFFRISIVPKCLDRFGWTTRQLQISLFDLSTSTSTWPLTDLVRLKANPPCSSISYLCYVQKLNRKKGAGNKYVVLQLEIPNARAPLSLSEQKSGESRERLQITLSQSLSFSLTLLTFSPKCEGARVCACACVCVWRERERVKERVESKKEGGKCMHTDSTRSLRVDRIHFKNLWKDLYGPKYLYSPNELLMLTSQRLACRSVSLFLSMYFCFTAEPCRTDGSEQAWRISAANQILIRSWRHMSSSSLLTARSNSVTQIKAPRNKMACLAQRLLAPLAHLANIQLW